MGISSKPVIAVLAVAASLLAASASVSAPMARGAGPAGVVPDTPTGTPNPHVSSRLFGASLDYQGGPVMHINRTHVIFWNPSNSLTWDPGYRELITGFLANVAADSHRATNVYGLTGQYGDATGHAVYDSSFVGALQDTHPAPASDCTLPAAAPSWSICLSDGKLRSELATFISANSLPTGLADVYFLVTPSGFGTCFSSGPMDCSLGGSANAGYCGYHSAIGPAASPTIYANIPYTAIPGHCQSGNPRPNGSADPTISTLSHEHNESITDPLISGWRNADFSENGDLCAGNFGPPLGGGGLGAYNQVIGTGHYFIQEEWSNEDSGGSCQAQDETDSVNFTAPSSARGGAAAAFGGSGVDPDGLIVSYSWDFGDGSMPVSGAAANHTFRTAGRFQVKLTVTDIGGQRAWLTKPVGVAGTPTAAFSATPSIGAVRRLVAFDGSGSREPGGSIVSYRWSFGDGSSAGTGIHPKHTYRRAAKYTVTLTVTDSSGVRASRSQTIKIVPLPTVAVSLASGSLLVAVNGPGQLTFGSTTRRVKKPGTIKVPLVLSASARHRLKIAHVLKLRLKFKFVSTAGPTVRKTVTITLRG